MIQVIDIDTGISACGLTQEDAQKLLDFKLGRCKYRKITLTPEVIMSSIAGGAIDPTTGKLADDDGKVLDSNGWRK